MPYILEVQKYKPHPEMDGRFEHIGYMNILFSTKMDACRYYDKYNPHMRSLNGHNTWVSDWDPNTELRFLVRKYNSECLKIDPFEE